MSTRKLRSMVINTLSSVQSKLGLLDRLGVVDRASPIGLRARVHPELTFSTYSHDEILILRRMTFWSKSGVSLNAAVEILHCNIPQKEIMRWEAF